MTSRLAIGGLHPGAMGAAVAATLTRGGHDVVWASAGRSAASRRRAPDTFEAAGLPGGFHRAAAEVDGRMAPLRTDDASETSSRVSSQGSSRVPDDPDLDVVLRALSGGPTTSD